LLIHWDKYVYPLCSQKDGVQTVTIFYNVEISDRVVVHTMNSDQPH
jgi:hypothetical protein